MVVFSNFLVVYFGLNYSSLFCVILVSSRRRIYMAVLSVETDPALISNFIAKNNSNNSKINCKK